jgi:hypothetical protein
MPMSDELRAALADPRLASMLRERAERVFRVPVTIFTEGDILAVWDPLVGAELARELMNTLAYTEQLTREEFALVGELSLLHEDCYRAWSAEVDTDGADWRQIQWSYTERNDHRSMLLHIARWDGQVVQVRTSSDGLSRLIHQLCMAQREFATKGGHVDAVQLHKASALIDDALESDGADPD